MEVQALEEHYNIIAASIFEQQEINISFVKLKESKDVNIAFSFHFNFPRLIRYFFSLFNKFFIVVFGKTIQLIMDNKTTKRNVTKLAKLDYELIIVHHFDALELASNLKEIKKVPVIFNAHEYYPLEFDNNVEWMRYVHPKMMRIGNKFLKNIDLCFSVGNHIGSTYQSQFGLKTITIPNTKIYHDLQPSQVESPIKLIHHGAAIRERKIELMIEVMDELGPGYELDFILVPGDPIYINELKNKKTNHLNINFIEPVDVSEIPIIINQYDIGIFLLSESNFNYKYALPNKLFEFIQARLAIAIGPSPEMADIVRKYNIGVVSDYIDSQSLAQEILKLTPKQLESYKINTNIAARELNIEENHRLIRRSVEDLIN